MGKKKKQKATAKAPRINWPKLKLYGMIAFLVYVSLAANGYEITLPELGGGGGLSQASALGFMPTIRATATEPDKARVPNPVLGVVGPIRPIPDGLNNYRGRGVTPDQLATFLTTSGVTKLLNLSGDIPGKITAAQCRAACAAAKVEYVTYGSLDRFPARSGYEEGRGFVRSAALASRYLAGGNVLIIDRSGNRTGALVGAYLISQHGFTVQQAIAHNNWEAFARNPGRSYQYLETVTQQPERPQ